MPTAGGDAERRLTEYQSFLLHANAGQPRDDLAPVPDAELADLDPDALAKLLRRARSRQPGAFRDLSDEVALCRLGVLVPDGDHLVPSLAGLLTLGMNRPVLVEGGFSRQRLRPGG